MAPTPPGPTVSSQSQRAGASYEVALPGEFGPALLATFADLGADHVATSSVFLMVAPQGQGVPDIAAMLEARGLVILDIRRVRATWPHPTRMRPATAT